MFRNIELIMNQSLYFNDKKVSKMKNGFIL